MSRLATLMIAAVLGIYILHGPRAGAVPPIPDWITVTSASAAAPAVAGKPPFAHVIQPLAMGSDPGGKSGTQAAPDEFDIAQTGLLRTSGALSIQSAAEAEYRAQLRDCDALDGDARNHCIEYVKLRSKRT